METGAGLVLAAEETGAGLVLTAEMLAPVTNAITSNLGVLLPVGIGIMSIMIGVHLIPRIIYKFF